MRTNYKVQNIQCGGCANTIKVQLASMANISEVEVDQGLSLVTFSYIDSSDMEDVVNKLNEIGFPMDKISTS